MKLAASIISILPLLAGFAHAQVDLPAGNQESAKILAEAGVVDASLPAGWGQLRTDIKGGNPLQMVAPGGGTFWRPDSVQTLEVPDGIEPVETFIEVELGGVALTLHVQPKPLQLHDPIVMVQLPDGSLQPYQQLPSNLYVGEVDGFPDSSVSASFRHGKLRALVSLGAGLTWEIQPLSDLTTGGDPKLHMILDASRPVPGPEGRCGVADEPNHQHPDHDHDAVPPQQGPEQQAGRARTMTIDRTVDEHHDRPGGLERGDGDQGDWSPWTAWDSLLAVDVDCYLYDNYNSVQDTLDFVYEVVNAANARYMQRFGFEHLVTYILVRTSCNGDPYQTSNPDDANQMLTAMRYNVWNASNPVPRNQAMLFTGRDLDGAIIGLAYDNSACVGDDGGHLLIEADWSAQTQLRYTVAKHELGHTWGARHTCDSWGTSGYCSVMCATLDPLACGLTNADFLPLSISQISTFRATASCNVHEGDIWYADARNPYFYPNGNQNHPFRSFVEAYNYAPDGQTVLVRGYGTQSEYVNGFTRLTRPMTITATVITGPARVR